MFLLSMIYVAQREARAQSPADKDMPAPPHTMVQKQS